ncbi:thioredoxin-like protein [Suillus paluster]|uniref:thioredoxin-like protein n=1 Tax=Suillus paluster TaxID=48578 RepID=UPI001B876850|nr:thioredoxin-like protein [Suillus paluster]KAG1727560.1 thioredoxin-like protein [Suillus paluster]
MDADIEHLVLSGKLFGTNSRSSSPERSPSPTLSFASASSDSSYRRTKQQPDVAQQESIGMGPGRTGVKGVIRDQHEAATLQAERRAREMEEVRKRMERANLGGKTFLEEEAEKEALDAERAERRTDMLGLPKTGRFGHLREVGRGGFVSAVEREDRGVWVVVHLYESSLDRCYALDDVLARLARTYPETKFSAGSSSSRVSRSKSDGMPGKFDAEEEEDVDTDVLPTLLVYRDGELVHNWVRVDWEAGQAGRNVISSFRSTGNCGLPEDDGDDLIWSDEEDRER